MNAPVRLIDDPAMLAQAAVIWGPIRARRLAREAAEAAAAKEPARAS